MSESTRRKIKQLRALAASTTFPEEAKSARAKADQLEAALPKASFAGPEHVPPPYYAEQAMSAELMRRYQEALTEAMRRHMYSSIFGGLDLDT